MADLALDAEAFFLSQMEEESERKKREDASAEERNETSWKESVEGH